MSWIMSCQKHIIINHSGMLWYVTLHYGLTFKLIQAARLFTMTTIPINYRLTTCVLCDQTKTHIALCTIRQRPTVHTFPNGPNMKGKSRPFDTRDNVALVDFGHCLLPMPLACPRPSQEKGPGHTALLGYSIPHSERIALGESRGQIQPPQEAQVHLGVIGHPSC